MTTDACRLCRSTALRTVIDLGYHPLADTFLNADALARVERRYPLRVALCGSCAALQSEFVVSAEERYQETEYSYDSSNSPVAVAHFKELADAMKEIAPLAPGDLAVDVGSNVGTLLGHLAEAGAMVVGVEPSSLAAVANERGIETIPDFFGSEAVRTIVGKHGRAKALSATNVFNHIEDVDGFFDSAEALLAEDGVIFLEVPYVPTLLEKTAFDTIYLEHVSYFSVTPFAAYAAARGWFPYHLSTSDYMGGSILAAFGRDPERQDTATLDAYRAREADIGIADPRTYEAFMARTRALKDDLRFTLASLKKDGKRIAGLGAATKGNTLLNYCGIDADTLECVLESSPYKIGKYLPGSHIPIRDEKDLDPGITHLLILPWNIGAYLKQKLGHLPVEFIVPHV